MSQRVISFHYVLTDKSGATLDSSQGGEPMVFMEGSGQIIPGLEQELLNLKNGDKKRVEVPAANAYGEKSEEYIVKVPREQLPADKINLGDRFRGGQTPESPMFIVVDVNEKEVTMDGNHPLAGQDLIFDVEVVGSRQATEEELQHGHAHGAHGHSH
jgi:FKBP-type peptidyl-prolyl cis-trans isomerase SlyD